MKQVELGDRDGKTLHAQRKRHNRPYRIRKTQKATDEAEAYRPKDKNDHYICFGY